ncbi:MAG: leucine-rich repeat protein [Clostridiales bacterium]|nr:leucine-rich repeat protein [Clostridiales bacterium]
MLKNNSISKKSIWSIVVVIMMAICFIAGNLSHFEAPTVHKPEDSVIESSRELMLFDTDRKLTQDDATSRIKAEYLKEAGGYRSGDIVSAIIELEGDAVIDSYLDGGSATTGSVGEYAASRAGKNKINTIKSKQKAFLARLNDAALVSEVGYSYSTVMNAVSVKVPYGNISKIEQMDGVKSVILSETYNLPMAAEKGSDEDRKNTVINDVDVYPDTGIFDSSSVSSLGITGKGTAVAVLDSGFDCSHEVFSHQPAGELWITQADVTAALSNPELNAPQTTAGLKMTDVWYSNKIPFTYDYGDKDFDVFPYDSEHGTHVAGIIGGQSDTITGVAIDTQLVLMKVFSDYSQGAEEEDILAAVEDSVLLGVDCINMSLGTSCGFSREADGSRLNEVYDKVNTSGISLICAASNSYSASFGGEQGNTNFVWNPDSSTVGSPSTYPAALSVASISGVMSSYLYVNDSDVVFFTESATISGKRNDFIKELYESQQLGEKETKVYEYITVPGYGSRINYMTVDVKGKIALVKRGGNISFEDKALYAKEAGAVACIIYNNVEGTISMSMGKSDHIPTVSITKEKGNMLALRSSGTIAVSKSYTAGPFMSDFSSWGPTPNLELKPEITAHGGEIKSSVPGGGYDNLSGTSMASPNLCGVVVLVRQFLKDKFPDYSQQQIVVLANQMLMSTATIVLNEEGNPYSPRKQGAGLASLSNVVNTKAYLSVDGKDRTKLELLDDPKKTGKYHMEFNVVNISDDDVEYNLSLIGMTETVSTSDNEHVAEKGSILGGKYSARVSGNGTLKSNKIKVKAGGTAKVSLDYTLTAADKKAIDTKFPNGMFVEGFVKLSSTEDIDLNVPFLAFYGDWTQAPIFDKTYYDVESEAHDGSIDDEDKLKADYYASTLYGSYYNNYVIPLGTYLYDIPAGYDAIPAVAEHASISDVQGTVDGIYAVYAGVLRNCKTMTYTITDKLTGEVIKEYVDYNVLKSFSNGGSPLPSFELLGWSSASMPLINNRQYEFKMLGRLDYGEDGGLTTNRNNTFKVDFTFDNEAPIIKSVVYEKEYDRATKKNRYYLTMTVFDNHFVQAITPIIFTSDSSYTTLFDEPIPVYSEKGKESKVRFEITDILSNTVYDAMLTNALGFAIDDYALNTNVYLCQLPGTRGNFKFTKNGEPDGSQLTILSMYEDEIIDLTKYLSTTDKTVDADKDYLKYLDWTSSSPEFAQVQFGQVRGIKSGKTTITATEYLYGVNASVIISVKPREEAALLTDDEPTAAAGQEDGNLGTAGAKNDGISTRSANDVPDVSQAEIDTLRFSYFETKYAYPRSGDTSMIGDTGSKRFLSAFTGRLEMYPGEKIKLFYEIQPWYVADKYPATYKSSNETIATVDQEGNITALKKGSVNITLELQGSNLMAILGITVNSEFVIDSMRTLVAYKGPGGHVVIPDDEGIMYIGAYSFCLYTTDDSIKVDEKDYDANKVPGTNSTVLSVTIPNGVEDIQKYAFYGCTALEEVNILGHVKYIRDFAFSGDVNLTKINLEDVYGVGRYAFEGCTSLDNINLKSMYSIGDHGFVGCSALSTLDLSALRNTGASAFEGCTSLKSVILNEHTKLAVRMFANSGLESVDIYERVEIPEKCFMNSKALEKVTIHNTLVGVGMGAFAGCSALESFEFKGGAQRIDRFAFEDCTALTSFTLPNSAVRLGGDVFLNCKNLTEIVIQKDTVISDIASALFDGAALSKITVAEGNKVYSVSTDGKMLITASASTPDTIVFVVPSLAGNYAVDEAYKYISAGAFGGSGITALTIQNPETVIGDYAFYSCKNLTSVTLPASDKVTIGHYSFANCDKLTTINNLQSILKIGNYAFGRTGLTQVTIGDNAVCGEGAFFESKLTTVTVGKNAKFGEAAFQECKALKTVNMPADGGVHFGKGCFSGDTALTTIDLSKHDGEIEEYAFFGCTGLTSVTLSEVQHIGEYAFAECSALATVNMPKVITIGEGAFSVIYEGHSAAAIKSLVLPETLTSLGEYAFFYCTRLTTVTILGSIEIIPESAFEGCTMLQRVELPATVTEIGDYAFYGCTRLSSINLGGVTTIGEGAFMYDSALANVDFKSIETVKEGGFGGTGLAGSITANKLVYAGDQAFQSVRKVSITSFTAPNLKYIGVSAFQDNFSLAEFVFSSDIEYVGIGAFYGCDALGGFYYLGDGGSKQSSGVVNGYAELVDGVLYTRMPNGDLMLSSIPAGRSMSTFILKERTTAIDQYAANANKTILNIVLADSLRSIGNFAFAGCTNLASVEFKSYTAPTLENFYVPIDNSYDNIVVEGDPGYELVHNQFSAFNDTLCYFNFIGLAGKYNPIKMILPANAGLVGYDSLIYEVFFGKQANAEISNYVAMDANLTAFIAGAKEIMRIKTLVMTDEQFINETISALEATSQKGTDYGYTAEEWKALVDAVYGAKQKINEMKGVKTPAKPTTEPSGGIEGWAIALLAVCVAVIVASGAIVAYLMMNKKKGGTK